MVPNNRHGTCRYGLKQVWSIWAFPRRSALDRMYSTLKPSLETPHWKAPTLHALGNVARPVWSVKNVGTRRQDAMEHVRSATRASAKGLVRVSVSMLTTPRTRLSLHDSHEAAFHLIDFQSHISQVTNQNDVR